MMVTHPCTFRLILLSLVFAGLLGCRAELQAGTTPGRWFSPDVQIAPTSDRMRDYASELDLRRAELHTGYLLTIVGARADRDALLVDIAALLPERADEGPLQILAGSIFRAPDALAINRVDGGDIGPPLNPSFHVYDRNASVDPAEWPVTHAPMGSGSAQTLILTTLVLAGHTWQPGVYEMRLTGKSIAYATKRLDAQGVAVDPKPRIITVVAAEAYD